MIMKMKISHHFLSIFAALVAFSLISTVALAAEIQPRTPTCPECNGDTYFVPVRVAPTALYITCRTHGVTCQTATDYRNLVCVNCGIVQRSVVYRTGYWCSGNGGSYHF